MKTYVLKGNPIALARARCGDNKKMWDPQKNLKLIQAIEIQHQHGNLPFYTGPLHLTITFFMPLSNKNKKTGYCIGKPHIFKPDLSNLLKYIEDIATGSLYKDDCLIASVSTRKIYDANPRTEFTIEELT